MMRHGTRPTAEESRPWSIAATLTSILAIPPVRPERRSRRGTCGETGAQRRSSSRFAPYTSISRSAGDLLSSGPSAHAGPPLASHLAMAPPPPFKRATPISVSLLHRIVWHRGVRPRVPWLTTVCWCRPGGPPRHQSLPGRTTTNPPRNTAHRCPVGLAGPTGPGLLAPLLRGDA
jgi:hypothetical protein